jgi:hypothetical protein
MATLTPEEEQITKDDIETTIRQWTIIMVDFQKQIESDSTDYGDLAVKAYILRLMHKIGMISD